MENKVHFAKDTNRGPAWRGAMACTGRATERYNLTTRSGEVTCKACLKKGQPVLSGESADAAFWAACRAADHQAEDGR